MVEVFLVGKEQSSASLFVPRVASPEEQKSLEELEALLNEREGMPKNWVDPKESEWVSRVIGWLGRHSNCNFLRSIFVVKNREEEGQYLENYWKLLIGAPEIVIQKPPSSATSIPTLQIPTPPRPQHPNIPPTKEKSKFFAGIKEIAKKVRAVIARGFNFLCLAVNRILGKEDAPATSALLAAPIASRAEQCTPVEGVSTSSIIAAFPSFLSRRVNSDDHLVRDLKDVAKACILGIPSGLSSEALVEDFLSQNKAQIDARGGVKILLMGENHIPTLRSGFSGAGERYQSPSPPVPILCGRQTTGMEAVEDDEADFSSSQQVLP